jgi:hypothetical protein
MKANLTLALAAVLALAGCSASTDAEPGDGPNTTPGVTADDTPPAGDIDCSIFDDEQFQVDMLGIQILAQLQSQSVVDTIKDGVLIYDPASMAITLEKLRVLAGHEVAGMGDPGEAVDFYLGANDIAAEILAVDGPVPQQLFDDLIAYEGDTADFLYRQVAFTAALDENCD